MKALRSQPDPVRALTWRVIGAFVVTETAALVVLVALWWWPS